MLIIMVFVFLFLSYTSLEAAKPTKLVYWIFLDPEGEDPRGKALKNVVNSFNESYPDIHVDVESIHWSKQDAQVIQATSAGTGPDLLNCYTDQLPMYVSAGAFLPLTQKAEGWIKEHSDYSFPIDMVRIDGEIFSIPWEIKVFHFWYRQDALKLAGLEPPKTLEEVRVIGGKLREASGGKDIGFAISLSEKAQASQFLEFFTPLTWAYGGQVFDDNGKPVFASEAGVAAMQWIKDAIQKYGVIGRECLTMTADDVTNGVKAGTIKMCTAGSMRVTAVRSAEGVGNNLVTGPIPGLTADEPSQAKIASHTIGIGAHTKYPEAAWEFIQYYLSMESQLEFAKAQVMPLLTSVYENPIIADDPMGAELKSWMEYSRDYGRMENLPLDYNLLAEALAKAAQKIVFENAPILENFEKIIADYEAL